MPRDPRGPEYGEPSRVERVVTVLLVVVIAVALAAAALAVVTDLGSLLGDLGPAWVTLPVAIAIVVLLAVLLTGG